ncbi:MAG: Dipeptidyl aminopeptidase/acylaminoacyl-peptidase [Myxococcaceae bacterium]|nr:Dipeptidyl aminopeptidase/acylaminoacyl-peptidase [Myxococcaceae bacterium]
MSINVTARSARWFAITCWMTACAGQSRATQAEQPEAPVDGAVSPEDDDGSARPSSGRAGDGSTDAQVALARIDGGEDALRDATVPVGHDASFPDLTDSAVLGASSARADSSVGRAGACSVSDTKAHCTSEAIQNVGAPGDLRRVYWAQPTTPPPATGYPAVVLYQGSFIGPATTWNADILKGAAFGGFYQVALIDKLLASGFVVIQPEAQGGRFWTTNTTGNYDSSADGIFIPLLLAQLEQGAFGTIDSAHLYATGISSGGYMTSRMAVSYPGRFRALAVESGSYATCAGAICNVPSHLPSDHPPTLLLHGGADSIVPIATAKDYYATLMANMIETKFVEDKQAGHEWLSTAPEDVLQWFLAH